MVSTIGISITLVSRVYIDYIILQYLAKHVSALQLVQLVDTQGSTISVLGRNQ